MSMTYEPPPQFEGHKNLCFKGGGVLKRAPVADSFFTILGQLSIDYSFTVMPYKLFALKG